MGLKCKIELGQNQLPVAVTEQGNISPLFKGFLKMFSDLDAPQQHNKAIVYWTAASDERFQEYTGKNEDTAVVEDVIAYVQAKNMFDNELSAAEEFEIKKMMSAAGVRSLGELAQKLATIFPAGKIDTKAAIDSGIYTQEDINSLEIGKIIPVLDRIYGSIMKDKDFEVESKDTIETYRNSQEKSILGTSSIVTLSEVQEQLLKQVSDPRDTNEIERVLSEMPFDEIYDKFKEDQEFTKSFLEFFEGLRKIEVSSIVDGELTVESKRKVTMRNTFPVPETTLPFKAILEYITNIPDVVFNTSLPQVKEILTKTEEDFAEIGVDIVGLKDLQDQGQIMEVLDTAIQALEQGQPNMLAEKLDEVFGEQDNTVIKRIDNEFDDITLVVLNTTLSPLEVFKRFGLIKLNSNVYQKISTTEDIQNAYNLLTERVQQGELEIPSPHKTYTSKKDTTTIQENLKTWMKTKDTGLGFKDERASLYQAVFKHKPLRDTTSKYILLLDSVNTRDEAYLTQDFISDFYSYILKEKVKDSTTYKDVLSKFDVTDNEITLNGDLISLDGIEFKQTLEDYIRLSKNPSLKHLVSKKGETENNSKLTALNNKEAIAEYNQPMRKEGNYVVTKPNTADYIRKGQDVYEKVAQNKNGSVYGLVSPQENPSFYTTKYEVANDKKEIERLLRTADLLFKDTETFSQKERKAGMLTPFFQNLKRKAEGVFQVGQTQEQVRFQQTGAQNTDIYKTTRELKRIISIHNERIEDAKYQLRRIADGTVGERKTAIVKDIQDRLSDIGMEVDITQAIRIADDPEISGTTDVDTLLDFITESKRIKEEAEEYLLNVQLTNMLPVLSEKLRGVQSREEIETLKTITNKLLSKNNKDIREGIKLAEQTYPDVFPQVQFSIGSARMEDIIGLEETKQIIQKLKQSGLSNNTYILTPQQIQDKLQEIGITDPNIQRQIIAWHGSPHSFKKFTTEAIGTGEGAQAFGWGLYFTDLKGIAKKYAKALSSIKNSVKIEGGTFPINIKSTDLRDFAIDIRNELVAGKNPKDVAKIIEDKYGVNDENRPFLRALKSENVKVTLPQNASKNLYKVYLNKDKTPEQYTWLVWDKLVSGETADKIKQWASRFDPEKRQVEIDNEIDSFSEKLTTMEEKTSDMTHPIRPGLPIRLVIERWDKSPTFSGVVDRLTSSEMEELRKIHDLVNERQGIVNAEKIDKGVEKLTGEQLYSIITKFKGNKKQASLFLLEIGIDGIKYPAESISRGATSDTARGFNYVVFDENAITIEEQIQFQKQLAENGINLTTTGFVYKGDVYLNEATLNPNTSIHEFNHLFTDWLKTNRPEIFNRGLELVNKEISKKNSDIQDTIDFVRRNQPNLTGENFALEVLTQLVGERGQSILESKKKTGLKSWLQDLWTEIKQLLGILDITPQQLSKLTLQEYADKMAIQLLKGEDITKSNLQQAIQRNNGNPLTLAPNGQPSILYQSYTGLGYTDTEAQNLVAQVYSDNFINWFGDWINDPQNASKVVDENGQPTLVFHGSPYSGITEFDRTANARKDKSGIKEYGTYFSNNIELAKAYRDWNELSDEVLKDINKEIEKWKEVQLSARNNRDYDNAEQNVKRLNLTKQGKLYPAFLSLRDVQVFDAKGKENVEAWNELEVEASYKWAKNRDAMEFLKEGKFGVEKKQGIIANNIVDAFVQGNEDLRNKFIGTVYLVFDGNENQIKSATENIGTFSPESNDIRYQIIGEKVAEQQFVYMQKSIESQSLEKDFIQNSGFTLLMQAEDQESLIEEYDNCE